MPNSFDFCFIAKSVAASYVTTDGDWLRHAFNTGILQEELPQEEVEIVALLSKLSHPCLLSFENFLF